MVSAGKPKRLKALHALIANEDILKRFVKGMSHMELPCDVGRWNNDCKGLFLGIRLGMKVIAFNPAFVNSVLDLFGVVGFFELLSHGS